MKARVFIAVIVFLCAAFLSTSAQGVVIPLSSHSSNNVPASWLDASMDLSVANVGYWELTLAVTNMTPETVDDTAFDMTELYFNTSATITSLTLNSVVGGSTDKDDWTLTLDMDNIKADGFGLFDISIISNNIDSIWIEDQETVTFKITIDAGTPPYSDSDFFTLSSQFDAHTLAYGAAKFIHGDPPGTPEIEDLSAYGAHVPEPATILMLGLGALALLRKRRD